MTKNTKMVLLGIGALVMYELWKGNQPGTSVSTSGSFDFNVGDNALSSAMASPGVAADNTLASLMNIPQGPGASPQDFNGVDLFNPLNSFCSAPNPALQPKMLAIS